VLPGHTVTVKLLNISEYTGQRLDGSFDFECNKARTGPKGYVSDGANSFAAVTSSTTTRLMRENIKDLSNLSLSTWDKGIVSETIAGIPSELLKCGLDMTYDLATSDNNVFNSAGGGFVIYLSRLNLNMTQSVYGK
jgi:hypothetical protein